jgi:hypothetical protein
MVKQNGRSADEGGGQRGDEKLRQDVRDKICLNGICIVLCCSGTDAVDSQTRALKQQTPTPVVLEQTSPARWCWQS